MNDQMMRAESINVANVPEVIAVLPLGHVISDKGEFDVDTESFQAINAQIAKRGVDLVIDYEHQTLKGGQAPAAGWVKELMLKDGQIQARVKWTPPATNYLRNKEYRYLSPVVTVRKSDGKVTGLHSLALTNAPAIEGMTPLVNSEKFTNDYQPGLKKMEFDDEMIRFCESIGVSKQDLLKYGPRADPYHMSLSAEFQSTKPDDSTQIICKQLGISESDLIQYGQQK